MTLYARLFGATPSARRVGASRPTRRSPGKTFAGSPTGHTEKGVKPVPHREPLYPDRCINCGRRTEASPCPLCGVVVCQLCAEQESSFCCDGEES